MRNLSFIDGTPEKPEIKSDWRVSDILFDGFAIIIRYSGKALDSREGKRLPRLEYDGMYAPDAIHIVLAQRSGCSHLATFDHDFLESKKEVQPILLDME